MIYIALAIAIFIVFPSFLLGMFCHSHPFVAYIIIGIASLGETFLIMDLVKEYNESKNDQNDFML
jgi:hypothetical protein